MKKIILLRFCPKKISWPGPKTQAPPPPPPPLEYQMDRALKLKSTDNNNDYTGYDNSHTRI